VSAKHRRASYRGGWNVRCLGDCVGHDADQCALAQFAAEQTSQEDLFGFGGRAEQFGHQLCAPRLRALARDGPDSTETGVDLRDRQRGIRRGRWERPQCRPADPDLALGKLTGQPRHHDRYQLRVVVGAYPAQQVGDPGDFGQPRRGGADIGRCRRDVEKLHDASLSRPSDIAGLSIARERPLLYVNHRRVAYRHGRSRQEKAGRRQGKGRKEGGGSRRGEGRAGYLTTNETECQPVAPSGTGSAISAVCTAPVLSFARTVMVCGPAVSACHGKLHSRQVSFE
jgi:hypothetical protein